MAIHIKDIDEAVRIIRDTREIITELDTIVSVSKIQRLSVRIDRFLDNIEEWESIETPKLLKKVLVINDNKY